MTWAVGYDERWKRDIGYGVPATCDHPGCGAKIDRGLAYVCGGEPYGGEHGCGLFFCDEHMLLPLDGKVIQFCERYADGQEPFEPTPDVPQWINHKLTHESWAEWRTENPAEVSKLQAQLVGSTNG